MKVLLVAAFGAAGALSRYGIGVATGTHTFPWATLGINLVGSFLLGLVLAATDDPTWRAAIGTGFLGAFTTFSTFSSETQTMLREDRPTTAAVYVAVSVVGGVAAAALGYLAGRNAA